jgi:hypothetical protein
MKPANKDFDDVSTEIRQNKVTKPRKERSTDFTTQRPKEERRE